MRRLRLVPDVWASVLTMEGSEAVGFSSLLGCHDPRESVDPIHGFQGQAAAIFPVSRGHEIDLGLRLRCCVPNRIASWTVQKATAVQLTVSYRKPHGALMKLFETLRVHVPK